MAMTMLWMHGASNAVHSSAPHADHRAAHGADREVSLGDAPLGVGSLIGCASSTCAVALPGVETNISAVDPQRRPARSREREQLRTLRLAPEPPVPRSVSVEL
jgi:hypothetical protein